jgi:hydrogenase maturation factor
LTHTGKEEPDFMRKAVYPHLGLRNGRIIVGPGWGLDNGILSVTPNLVMIITVDPVSVIPEFGIELSAWTSVHLIASDYFTSGANPQYATFSYNFPASMPRTDREAYVEEIGDECRKLGISIVGGHTGSYPGGGFTVVGTGSVFGFCKEGAYVTPKMARARDTILLTKHPAIEAAASLALCFPSYTERHIGASATRKVQRMIRMSSTVKDAMVASRAGLGPGGVTSMHDATEGGVLGALEEMAFASGKRFEVDLDTIYVPAEVRAVCAAFDIDPLTSLGEGALLITCNPEVSEKVAGLLSHEGIESRVVGTVKSGSGLWVRKAKIASRHLKPAKDGYWRAYDRSVSQHYE